MSDDRDPGVVPAGIERSGLEILGFVESGGLVESGHAWRLVAGLEAAIRVPIAGGDLASRVDTAWLEQARAHGVIAADDTFLIDTGYERPWLKVRWTQHTRLAANLVSKTRPTPGEAEFVTLAEDGSAMCGVTTEEYDIWVILDAERIHQPDPSRIPIDPATIDISGLHPLKIFHLFGPRRLQPPFQDGWVLLGFHATARYLGQIHQLPASFDDAAARQGSGGREPVHDAPIPLDAAQAMTLASTYGLPVHAERILYYLEYQPSADKAAQSRRRRAPE